MKVLVFGGTGSAGSGVLKVCIASPRVSEVRAIVRRSLDLNDTKLHTVIHQDFLDYSRCAEVFEGLDACFYCLGISVTKVSGEPEYRRITHDFAAAAARMLSQRSPGATFHYISGAGAGPDSRFMWARVKAETERDLIDSVGALCWRPGAIDGPPTSGTPWTYRMVRPFFPLMKPIRSLYVTGEDIGRAMIQATVEKQRARVIENAEIRDMADRSRREESASSASRAKSS
ncbi:MAG TPA: hypothetical protein VIF83_01510 [Gemmatimonadaceae bacterium]|jgi:uncharacterized protein YbjT (DUF2867 family)